MKIFLPIWFLLAICMPATAQNTINPNRGGFTVGEWYEDCKGHSFDSFYISGSCTYVQRHHDTAGNEWNTTSDLSIPAGTEVTWYDGRFNACFNSSWPQDSQHYPYLVSLTYQVTLSPVPNGFDPNDPPQAMPQETWMPLSGWSVNAPNYWQTPSQYAPGGTIPYPEEYFTPMVDQNNCDQQAPFQWSPGYKNNTSTYQTVTENGQSWQLAPGQSIPPQYTDAQQGNQSLTITSDPQNGYMPDTGTMFISLSNDVPIAFGDTNVNNDNQFANGQDGNQLSQLGVTNSPIIWDITNNPNAPESGLALDSTLRAGFSAMANLLDQANGYLSRGFGVVSNSAGIIIVSNFYNPFFTNIVNLSVTNGTGDGSNVWVQNWPSNGYWAGIYTNTGTGNLTTNEMGDLTGAETNPYDFGVVEETNYLSASTASQAAQPGTQEDTWENNWSQFVTSVEYPQQDDAGPPSGMTYSFGDLGTLDVNPADYPGMVQIFSAVKNFLAWLLAFFYTIKVIGDVERILAHNQRIASFRAYARGD